MYYKDERGEEKYPLKSRKIEESAKKFEPDFKALSAIIGVEKLSDAKKKFLIENTISLEKCT